MTPRKSPLFLGMCLSAFCPQPAHALGQATDGQVVVRYGASHWDGSPEADLVGTESGDPNRDLLAESGWWLRIQGADTRELPFPAPTEYPDTGNSVWTGYWANLRGSGLSVYETVTAANSEGPSGTYVSRLQISNFGSGPLTFSVFHYLNPDPDSGAQLEDASALAGTPNMIRFDGVQPGPGGSEILLGQVFYRAGGADRRACRTDSAPLSAILNDASADDLDNAGLPIGPTAAGVDCGYEWTSVTLNPSAAMCFLVSVSSNLPKLSVKGDFDSDNLPDLLWYNTSSGNVVVWYMDANLVRLTGAFTTPAAAGGAGWRVVASGDFGRGDGSERPDVPNAIDLIWQNTSSGRLVVWHMNTAAERTSGAFLAPDSAPGYEVLGPRGGG